MTLNSYDEWSKLKEVVVGTATNYAAHDRELSFLRSARSGHLDRLSASFEVDIVGCPLRAP